MALNRGRRYQSVALGFENLTGLQPLIALDRSTLASNDFLVHVYALAK
jgi:hypothetical protein